MEGHYEFLKCIINLPPSISHIHVSWFPNDLIVGHGARSQAYSEWIPRQLRLYNRLRRMVKRVQHNRVDVRVILDEIDDGGDGGDMVLLALQVEQRWLETIGSGRSCWGGGKDVDFD